MSKWKLILFSAALLLPTVGHAARSTVFVAYDLSQSPLSSHLPPASLTDTSQVRTSHLAQFNLAHEEVLTALLKDPKTKVTPLWIANGAIMELTSLQIAKIRKLSVVRDVSPAGRTARLTNYTYGLSRIKIPEVRARFIGIDGTGVMAGVIDTGIDARHPDLSGKVTLYRDYVDPRIVQPRDDHGHGTHVAGTIAGGMSSGLSIGVAPKSSLIIAKAFDGQGDSKDSDLLSALEWMADPDKDPATNDFPKVINASWNVDGDIATLENATNPFCVSISNLRKLGIATVVAAGNDGPRRNSIKVPGACPDAITVAATDDRDRITDFSSRGPSIWKDGTVQKPDISAPGEDINSANRGGGYRTRSGTSMASPHVAGFMALVLQKNGLLSVDDAVRAVQSQATDLGSPGFDTQSGAGLLNCYKSIEPL